MKKLLLVSIVAAALGVSTSALAQTAGPVGGAPKPPVAAGKGTKAGKVGKKEMAKINDEVMAKLNLTADQKAKIKAHDEETSIQETTLKQRVKAAKKGGTTDSDATEKLKAMRKENKAFMKQVLTKEQMKEMMKLRREAIKDYTAKNNPTPAKP